jgi:hypothetical protein
VKQFNYRGVVRTFSNRYHIGTAGPPPFIVRARPGISATAM